jgi:hypothetical protein
MIISTVGRRVRSRVKDLGARCIDVSPGTGEPEFTFSHELWEAYRLRSRFDSVFTWEDLLELAMWELSIRFPINWLKLMHSQHIVLIDKEPFALEGKETARAQTAIALYKVLKRKGYKVEIGHEYADERKRA